MPNGLPHNIYWRPTATILHWQHREPCKPYTGKYVQQASHIFKHQHHPFCAPHALCDRERISTSRLHLNIKAGRWSRIPRDDKLMHLWFRSSPVPCRVILPPYAKGKKHAWLPDELWLLPTPDVRGANKCSIILPSSTDFAAPILLCYCYVIAGELFCKIRYLGRHPFLKL